MTNLDMTSSNTDLVTIWTAPAKARRGRPSKPIGKVEQRIESIILGVMWMDAMSSVATGRGLRMEEISAITGYTAAQCRPIMQRLIAAGVIRRTGNTRGTRYQAVGL